MLPYFPSKKTWFLNSSTTLTATWPLSSSPPNYWKGADMHWLHFLTSGALHYLCFSCSTKTVWVKITSNTDIIQFSSFHPDFSRVSDQGDHSHHPLASEAPSPVATSFHLTCSFLFLLPFPYFGVSQSWSLAHWLSNTHFTGWSLPSCGFRHQLFDKYTITLWIGKPHRHKLKRFITELTFSTKSGSPMFPGSLKGTSLYPGQFLKPETEISFLSLLSPGNSMSKSCRDYHPQIC